MNEPTQEQIKELWEWCGWHYVGGYTIEWISPDQYPEGSLPPIDLNNLFKWAVPKLGKYPCIKFDHEGTLIVAYACDDNDRGAFASAKDPALALFWALRKVIKED